MKKLFTYAMAACFAMAAWAQDTSGWTKGQDVTDQLQWKATVADDENIDDPYWKGFQYGQDAPSTWEFRDGSGGERDDYHSWGVYNVSTWDVYQEFAIPAGVYTLKMAGAYREGTTNITFDKWLAGEQTKNAFMYVKVGEDVFETPLMYMFAGAQKEMLFDYGSNWQTDCHFTNKAGEEIYGPSCHWGADKYLAQGNWNWNEVLFIVPEATTIRIGIDKRVDQPQDQVWWNEWRMIYEQPYDESAKALVAYNDFKKTQNAAIDFAEAVCETYPTLGAIMQDEIMFFDEKNDVSKNSTYEELTAAIEEMKAIDASNHEAFTNTQTMEFVIGVCEGILEVTDFSGKADLEAAVNNAKSVLYDADNLDATVADYLAAADNLNKARIAYLLTQEKATDGSYDFTHAISNPWFVNQEYTPTYDAASGTYKFPEAVETTWFGSNAPDDETDMEREATDKAGETLAPVADKAHWSTSETAEERWIYQDKWAGWHGGMKNCIQKLKGYAAFYSGWASGANANGGMWVTQVLNDLPEGLYTLEGYVFIAEDGYATDGNQYIFMNDAEGNECVKLKNETTLGFWSFGNRNQWIKLKTDFFYAPGGKVTVGYHHNSMAGNAGMVLKYYGTELDYNALLQNKIAENAPAEGELWAGDLATYNEMVAQIAFPISDVEAYTVANKQLEDAIAFKKTAASAIASYNLIDKYGELMATYDAEEAITEFLSVAQFAVMTLGEGENDSYKDIEPATAIYNAYASYAYKYAEAETYNKEKINDLLAEQFADLKANYASVETLVAYERALATPINEAIFEEKGSANASEENPMDITDMLANPSFADGPKTGWTCEGEDCNPSINTYGRELAECWNQKPFTISQTLRSLPAGNYQIRVRACYRDGSTVDQGMIDRAKNGEGQNAFLFAATSKDEVSTPVVSTAAGEWTTPSFDKWWNAQGSEEAKAAGFMEDWDGTICILEGEESILNEDDLVAVTEINLDSPAYPFDTKVGANYYPSSMAGFKYRITKTEDAYVNTVSIYVREGDDLTLGFKKIAAESGDWLIYDDFELFYLGNTIPDGISNVDAPAAAQQSIFNVAGQRLATPQKGINIINGKKVYVK
ncbi:MAG: hypothetical protein IJP82_02815 [Bacteroidaceae bacterium]|nr:hypothetical protein [Bacteroidaceae bacterium]